MTAIRAAITQTTWTGDKESMLDKQCEQFAREAKAQGARVICFQELFYSPYLGITEDVKYYDFAEPADGPIVQRFPPAAELSIVAVLPIFEEEQPGVYYNTAVVVDADGTVLGKYRKNHIPNLDKFWEKFYFRPGNLGYPVFQTAVGPIGVYICYDRHFPEGWRELGLNGAQIVFNPNATKPGLSNRLWEIEQPAAAAANGYFIAAPNRVGREDNEFGELAVTFYGSSQFCDPQGNVVGAMGSDEYEEVVIRDLDLDMIRQVRNAWQLSVIGGPSPTPRSPSHDRKSLMTTTLIKNGTVINATGSAAADVLVDGETIVALLARGSSDLEAAVDMIVDAAGRSSSRGASTHTPTWNCRSAAHRPLTPLRPVLEQPLGAAPLRSSTSRFSATASGWRKD